MTTPGRPNQTSFPPPSPPDSDATEADHAATLPRVPPRSLPPPVPPAAVVHRAPASIPPPPPPPKPGDPMLDVPTRHLLISQPETPTPARPVPRSPTLATPGSWADEEGTAALMLPPFDMTPEPAGRVAVKREPPPRRALGLPLGMAALGALLMLGVMFVVGRLGQSGPLAPSDIPAAQQFLIDEALFTVQTGHIDQAIGLLQRFQRNQAAPDPAVDVMIAALKRRLR